MINQFLEVVYLLGNIDSGLNSAVQHGTVCYPTNPSRSVDIFAPVELCFDIKVHTFKRTEIHKIRILNPLHCANLTSVLINAIELTYEYLLTSLLQIPDYFAE